MQATLILKWIVVYIHETIGPKNDRAFFVSNAVRERREISSATVYTDFAQGNNEISHARIVTKISLIIIK